MRITPEANNAIIITLDDGSEFKLHHTLHGEGDCLFITNNKGIAVSTRNGLEWSVKANETIFKLLVNK